MDHHTFSEMAVPKPGGSGGPATSHHEIYFTVHGIVQGWTTAGGKPVAVVDQRSTYNHEIDSGVGFLGWATPALHPRCRAPGWPARQQVRYTFNWFYVDNQDIGYYVSGRDPIRPANVDPNLPTWGTGVAEWQGFLPADRIRTRSIRRRASSPAGTTSPRLGSRRPTSDYGYGPV